jgi:hypothetical protein
MFRSIAYAGVVTFFCVGAALGQADSSLESYFTGKEVVVKIDMPGTQKGIDLKYNKPTPMDWNDYSSRLKSSGIAIHKGDVARITKFVVKSDMIEFQLNGGGFGTAGDDSNTVISAMSVPKSQYEKDLEKQISDTNDAKKKRDLQSDLDRERSRRERQDAKNRSDAQIASQLKAQQVADRRLQGGSRFNLRWQGSIPSDSKNPDAVMKLLSDYVDFNGANAGGPPANAPAAGGYPPAANPAGISAASQLKRGMRVDDVSNLLGQGKVVSESTSNEGLKTQVLEYTTADSVVNVTSVEGVVVKYSISSR